MSITAEKIDRAVEEGHYVFPGRYGSKMGSILEAEENGWEEISYEGGYGGLSIVIDGDLYPVEVMDDFGGEGMGDKRYVVIEVGGRFFRKDGWHQSHYGSEFDCDLYEAQPVERMITEYVPA